ncbi:MAG: hypothetical protein IJ661_03015 [Lachnospiraceae bacterium]|nr:hypothetical protein [Lachnospiraceae bacterium]
MMLEMTGHYVHYLSVNESSAELLRKLAENNENLECFVVRGEDRTTSHEEDKDFLDVIAEDPIIIPFVVGYSDEAINDNISTFSVDNEEDSLAPYTVIAEGLEAGTNIDEIFTPDEGAIELVEGCGIKDCKLELTLLFERDESHSICFGENYSARKIEAEYAYVCNDRLVIIRRNKVFDKLERTEVPIEIISKLVQMVEIDNAVGYKDSIRVDVIDTGRSREIKFLGKDMYREYRRCQCL